MFLIALALLSSSLLFLSSGVPPGFCLRARRAHPTALVHRWQSVEALIAAAEVVQEEVGPSVPGTYRHDFMNDREPRQVPM